MEWIPKSALDLLTKASGYVYDKNAHSDDSSYDQGRQELAEVVLALIKALKEGEICQ